MGQIVPISDALVGPNGGAPPVNPYPAPYALWVWILIITVPSAIGIIIGWRLLRRYRFRTRHIKSADERRGG